MVIVKESLDIGQMNFKKLECKEYGLILIKNSVNVTFWIEVIKKEKIYVAMLYKKSNNIKLFKNEIIIVLEIR